VASKRCAISYGIEFIGFYQTRFVGKLTKRRGGSNKGLIGTLLMKIEAEAEA
jgi:hypothetical protein